VTAEFYSSLNSTVVPSTLTPLSEATRYYNKVYRADNLWMFWNKFASDSTTSALYGNMCKTLNFLNHLQEHLLRYYWTWL